MEKSELIERERRRGVWALGAALLAAILIVVGQSIEISVVAEAESDAEDLILRSDSPAQAIGGSALRALGFGLFLMPLMLLFDAAAARSERPMARFRAVVVMGPIAFALSTLLLTIALDRVAADFVAGTPVAGEAGEQRADDLREDHALVQIGRGLGLAGFLALTFGMIYTCLQAMRVGLLTRFAGTLGMAFGAFLFIGALGGNPVGLFGSLLFLIYVGFVATGRNLGGRPPAWETGEARPWPAPGASGQPQGPPPEEPARPEDFGAEEEEPAERERPGRRDNRRKRKRKQRR